MSTVAIVGGGPSGLYLAKYLSDWAKINIYEKENNILGNYYYSLFKKTQSFYNILQNENINLFLNKEIKNVDELSEDIIVLCTGASARPPIQNTKSVFEHIQKITNKESINMGENICILGSGNVAMDFLLLVKDKINSATVVSRSGLYDSKFDNFKIRLLMDDYSISTNLEKVEPPAFKAPRKDRTRYKLFTKINEKVNTDKPKINFLFETASKEIENNEITLKTNDKLYKKVFDDIFSSIGFIPNNNLKTNKNKLILKLGWCVEAKGDLAVQQRQAAEMASYIKTNLAKNASAFMEKFVPPKI